MLCFSRKYAIGKCAQEAFTLIELMIVIAIVAILVSLAVPAYQDYTIRSKVAECVNNAAIAKLAISEYRETMGIWPANAGEAGLGNGTTVTAGVSQYCNAFIMDEDMDDEGAFDVSVNTAAVDANITGDIQPRLTPSVDDTSQNIDWSCNAGETAAGNVKYLPAICRGPPTCC